MWSSSTAAASPIPLLGASQDDGQGLQEGGGSSSIETVRLALMLKRAMNDVHEKEALVAEMRARAESAELQLSR